MWHGAGFELSANPRQERDGEADAIVAGSTLNRLEIRFQGRPCRWPKVKPMNIEMAMAVLTLVPGG